MNIQVLILLVNMIINIIVLLFGNNLLSKE